LYVFSYTHTIILFLTATETVQSAAIAGRTAEVSLSVRTSLGILSEHVVRKNDGSGNQHSPDVSTVHGLELNFGATAAASFSGWSRHTDYIYA
jgi:hypothetical protein